MTGQTRKFEMRLPEPMAQALDDLRARYGNASRAALIRMAITRFLREDGDALSARS